MRSRTGPNPEIGETSRSHVAATVLLAVEELARELDPARHTQAATLDSRLDRDLGIDSLGRAELVARIERAFGVAMPEHILAEAETPRDLLTAVLAQNHAAPILPRPSILPAPAVPTAAPAPVAATTLCAVLDWHADRHADRPHMILEGAGAEPSTISYRVLAKKARSAARGLRELNIAAGDRVAIMLPTGESFVTAFFGALYAGAVPVPIYPPARAGQIEDHLRRQAAILANAGAAMLIAPPALRSAAGLLRSLVDSVKVVTSVDELPVSAETALPRIDRPGDTALLQYTSGSTGAPKGVVMTHANLLANIRALGMATGASAADVFVSWLPFYHNMGLIGAWLGSLYFAAPLVTLSPQGFLLRPESWLWAIHRHRGTLSAAPNFAFELCLRNIEDRAIEGLDLSSLRLVANGSEPVSATTLRRFLDRFGRYGFRPEAMAPAYGLAESGVALTLPPRGWPPVIDRISRRALTETGIAEPARNDAPVIELVSCGAPLPSHEIRVVDDTEHELGERREGRLQFRGPSATRGYFRDTAKTRELFSGDWLESGDLGYFARGNLFVTGRTKDIIIRAGRHIYPSEIEEAVGEIPGLHKDGVAVFGSHDPRSGTERVILLVETTAPPELTPRVATTYCRGDNRHPRGARRRDRARCATHPAKDSKRKIAPCRGARTLRVRRARATPIGTAADSRPVARRRIARVAAYAARGRCFSLCLLLVGGDRLFGAAHLDACRHVAQTGMALDSAAVDRAVGVLADRRATRHRAARRAAGQRYYRQQSCELYRRARHCCSVFRRIIFRCEARTGPATDRVYRAARARNLVCRT